MTIDKKAEELMAKITKIIIASLRNGAVYAIEADAKIKALIASALRQEQESAAERVCTSWETCDLAGLGKVCAAILKED